MITNKIVATTPICKYEGTSPMAKVAEDMNKSERSMEGLRPNVSPMTPKRAAPKGRNRKLIP